MLVIVHHNANYNSCLDQQFQTHIWSGKPKKPPLWITENWASSLLCWGAQCGNPDLLWSQIIHFLAKGSRKEVYNHSGLAPSHNSRVVHLQAVQSLWVPKGRISAPLAQWRPQVPSKKVSDYTYCPNRSNGLVAITSQFLLKGRNLRCWRSGGIFHAWRRIEMSSLPYLNS